MVINTNYLRSLEIRNLRFTSNHFSSLGYLIRFCFLPAMEQIRTKEKYQVRQIKQGEETSNIENGNYSPNTGSFFGENRLSSVKQVLQTNSKDIEQIIKDVNEVKRTLGM